MTDCPVCLGTEVILVLQQVILLCQKIQMTFVSLSLGHQNGGWGRGGYVSDVYIQLDQNATLGSFLFHFILFSYKGQILKLVQL